MMGKGHIAKGLRNGLMAVSLLALAACTTLTSSNIAVSQTGDRPAPTVVPEGTDPDDAVIGRREHPRIIAAYGGVYSDPPKSWWPALSAAFSMPPTSPMPSSR
mgnify:CR=1 FL=1